MSTYLQDDLALVLVAESSLVSSEHSLGVQTGRGPLQRGGSDVLGDGGGLLAFNHCVCVLQSTTYYLRLCFMSHSSVFIEMHSRSLRGTAETMRGATRGSDGYQSRNIRTSTGMAAKQRQRR